MARIAKEEMNKRIRAIEDLLEDHTDGLTIQDLITHLAAKGVSLPKSAYQGVNIVLQTALFRGLVTKNGHKWKLVSDEPVATEEDSQS